nr:MAG TPA: hypothetical protein [Caudoviricetes sp.]
MKNKAFRTSKVEGNFSFLWTDWRCEYVSRIKR